MSKIPAVQMRNISKKFGYIEALRQVDFEAWSGEVTAVVGDNGSGKSTLMKILSGCLQADAGTIEVQGNPVRHNDIRTAIRCGITTVYQDLALDSSKDCAENIFLGREPVRLGIFLDKKTMYQETKKLLRELGISIADVYQRAERLSGGQRQALAIARAVHQSGDIVIFDEPTSAMGMKETAKVMRLFARLKEEGKAVLLISHDLFQVFDIADRICVMKNGQCVDTFLTAESTPQQVYDMIVREEESADEAVVE